MSARLCILVVCTMMIVSCQPNKKSNVRTAHIKQTATEKHSIENHVGNEIENQKEKLSQDSIYMILDGVYSLPNSIGDRLPANAKEYFLHINFPYRLPKDLRIDYFCKKKDFQIDDLFIFKTKNGLRACEYIALTDTFPFIEIVARKCDEMENWIMLYVLNEEYKIIDSEILLQPIGYDEEPTSLKLGTQSIRLLDMTDTLTYSNRQYRVFSDEVFEITDDSGKNEKDIGIRRLKMFTVSERGRIIKQCDSVVYQKEYYDMFWTKRE